MRYIDVEPLEDKLKEHIKKTESELMLGALSTFLRVLDITPTADVAPIKRGHWVDDAGALRCSECGVSFPDLHPLYENAAYCPNCGARMDGESDE